MHKIDCFFSIFHKEPQREPNFEAFYSPPQTFLHNSITDFCEKRKNDHLELSFSRNKILLFFAKSPNKPKDSTRKLIFACLLEICVFICQGEILINFMHFCKKIRMPHGAGHSSCSVLQRRAASFGVVQGWDGTYLPRPSHDDGTFTQGKLPQIIIDYY